MALPDPMRFSDAGHILALTRFVIMDTERSRQQARECRRLAGQADERTAQHLEMLADAYDEDAHRADVEAENGLSKRQD
jgi:hypothetical protein